VLTYKELVQNLAQNAIVPEAVITDVLKDVGQTEKQLHDHVEQQRKVADLNEQVIKVREFFARGATLSEEIQTARKTLQEAEQAYAAWNQEVREQGQSKNEHLQKLEAELHALWPKLVSDLHECAMRRSRDW
jgi:multidrug resistance efflux pump